MLNYIWPIALVAASNVVYHIVAKMTPVKLNPFLSLTITYLVGALVSGIIYFIMNKNTNIIQDFTKVNWTPFLLGIAIVGLEAGWLYAYKAGWQVNTASIVQSSVLAVALIIVGFLLFKETLTWNKVVGMGICLLGIVFINLK